MAEEQEVNPGHYPELMDRLHVMCSNIDEHLLSHPLTVKEEFLKLLMTDAQKLLSKAYQEIGNLEQEMEENK